MPTISETYEAFTVLVDEFTARTEKLFLTAIAERDNAEVALHAYHAKHGDIEHGDHVGCALQDRYEAAELVVHELQHGLTGLAPNASGAYNRGLVEKRLQAVSADVAKYL